MFVKFHCSLKRLRTILLWSIFVYTVYQFTIFTQLWTKTFQQNTRLNIAWQITYYGTNKSTETITSPTPFKPRSFHVAVKNYTHKYKYNRLCVFHKCVYGSKSNASELQSNFSKFSSEHELQTIVTAYFNLGSFQKGVSDNNNSYTTQLYYSWLSSFNLLMNDVVVVTDDTNVLRDLEILRSEQTQRTCMCLVHRSRTSLWPFRLVPLISDVLSQPGYPKHHPNTVMPEYGAAMHAKYAVMQLALDWNPFNASYFTWMDVGIFRDLVQCGNCSDSDKTWLPLQLHKKPVLHEPFYLDLPPDWDRTRVAMNQVGDAHYNVSVLTYFTDNTYWVGGGYFVATREVMYRWIEQYRRTLFASLAMGLSNTDQQVLYAMFHPSLLNVSRVHPNASAIVYTQNYRKRRADSVSEWFYLPYLCRQRWFSRFSNINCEVISIDLHVCGKPADVVFMNSFFLLISFSILLFTVAGVLVCLRIVLRRRLVKYNFRCTNQFRKTSKFEI